MFKLGHLASVLVVGDLIVSGLVLSQTASAQEVKDTVVRNQTVSQRPRPNYDARGIAAGGFKFFPRVSASVMYDDNIFASAVNEQDDIVFLVRPEVTLASDWSRHSLSVNAYGLFQRYADLDSQNTTDWGASATGRLDLARNATFNMRGTYDRLTVDRSDPEEAGRLTPEQVDVTSGLVSYTQPFTRLRVTLTGEISDYSEASVLDRVKDRTDMGGRLRLGYELSPAIFVFAEPFFTRRDFDLPVDLVGVNRDSDLMGGTAGVAYDITGILYGETTVGYYHVNFDDNRFRSDSGISVSSSTTWNVTALTSLIAQVARQNVVTNEPGSSSRKQLSFSLEAQHDLASNIVIGAKIGYTRDVFLGSTRTDRTLEGSASAEYFLDRHLSIRAEYSYRDRSSTIAGAEFSGNRILIGLRAQL